MAAPSIFAPLTLPDRTFTIEVVPGGGPPPGAGVVGHLVGEDDEVPSGLGLDRSALRAAGFGGRVGETLVLAGRSGPVPVAVGTGASGATTTAAIRDAAASLARAVPHQSHLAVHVPVAGPTPAAIAEALVEGVALARYEVPKIGRPHVPSLEALTLVTSDDALAEVTAGARRGQVLASACALGRDLANAPVGNLTAVRIAELAVEVGTRSGLEVEVFDETALHELGCGGLLGVNLGSVSPPRMVRLTYDPSSSAGPPTGRLALVGKGIMYDSGGIALKPGDAVHATMKNDMSGAGSVLAAMSALAALGCRTHVTGYLMCTDNMPSGSALALGDVLTIRGGRTVEVKNTDAEGRLVMADALVLATEQTVDAIVDIATLTGACLRALGTEIAGVMGNHQPLVDQVAAAAERTDEPVWQLPLAWRYRTQLDSDVADVANLGGPNAGALTAAVFLAEFVGDVPWAHLDIAGTAQADAVSSWRNKGATGFGTRLLVDLAVHFVPPTPHPSTPQPPSA